MESDDSLFLLPIKMGWKKKLKLGIKIYCLKIQETGHFIPRKYRELK